MIKKVGSKWILYSRDGTKKLGEFDTKEDAEEREKEINRIKHMKNKQFKAYQTSSNNDGTINIHDVEIFKLGRHKGFDYDEDWSQKAINNFNSQKADGFFPSVIIGHNDGKEEKPARGFMDNLKLDGDIVKSDIVKIPQDIFKNLKERQFPHRSVEINPDDARFTALALLGSTSPYHKLPIMEFGEDPDNVVIEFAARKTTIVQTIIFDKEKFKKSDDAKSWLKEHDYKSGGMDETDESFRFRQIEPDQFDPKSFRIIELTEGIKAVIGKLKTVKKFEDEIDLEEAIDLDQKLSKIRSIWYKMMDFINKIIFDTDKPEKDKRDEIKDLLNQGTDLLGKENKNFKEGDNKMSDKIQLTEDQANEFRETEREKFKEQHGIYPEDAVKKVKEFEASENKRQSEARQKAIKDFGDALKKEGVAPALVDNQIIPFMNSLDGDVKVKFREEDKDVEKPQMEFFQSFVEGLLKTAKENKLFVPLDERVKGVKFDSIDSDESGQAYDAKKVDKQARALMKENPKLKYEDAVNRIISAEKE